MSYQQFTLNTYGLNSDRWVDSNPSQLVRKRSLCQLCHSQCDQIVNFFQNLAICNNENLPNNVTSLPK